MYKQDLYPDREGNTERVEQEQLQVGSEMLPSLQEQLQEPEKLALGTGAQGLDALIHHVLTRADTCTAAVFDIRPWNQGG